MAELKVERATLEHAAELAACMHPLDVSEVKASGGATPFEALKRSIEISKFAAAFYVDSNILCIWGLAEKNGFKGAGVPWVLTSVYVEKYPKIFYKESRRVIDKLKESYWLLINVIDARHLPAVRFFKRMGFAISEAIPYGVEGLPFHRATMQRS